MQKSPNTHAKIPQRQKIAAAGFEPETSHPQRIGKCCASQSVEGVLVIN
jgi:hypothetical protein